MKRFSKILVIADSAEENSTAIIRAIELAETNQAEVTLIDVVQEIPGGMQMAVVALPYDQLINMVVTEKRETLEKIVAARRDGNVAVAIDVLKGKPFLEIIRKVIHDDYDLVIKTEDHISGVGKILFGSTDMHLMRKCPCPVWITKSDADKRYRRIIAAVDNDPDEPLTGDLNQQILDMSFSLALSESSELHIVNAWYYAYETFLRSPQTGLSEDEIDEMIESEYAARKAWLKQLVAKFGAALGKQAVDFVEPVLHVAKGDPSVMVPMLASELGADLVVMGTVARTGINGFLMGNTAETILSQLDCSVLTVKPAGFVSPVAA